MKRKVEKANIQQGFVLDTVIRLTREIVDPKLFCAGSFEDTAFAALKKLGYDVSGVDPVLDYDLDTYLTKPSIKTNYFDAVFSTSVIEHVEDDLNFLRKMAALTRRGGYVVLTCDFKEGFNAGDPKPGCDYRLYTQEHLQYLLSKLPELALVGEADWRCPIPDFGIAPIQYAFASIVLQKQS
jgi:SAM-dependent methyltransferase